jgi:hypothetical protein
MVNESEDDLIYMVWEKLLFYVLSRKSDMAILTLYEMNGLEIEMTF